MLDSGTRSLVRFAAAIARGGEPLLAGRAGELFDAKVPPIWVDELLLQSVLMVGYPRALAAALAWRQRDPLTVSLEDGTDFSQLADWILRGESICRKIYNQNYVKLRENVRRLHPALDAWMVQEGYGRTLGRPGLDLVRRELCIIAQVAVLGADRQLHSHLRGALNAGAAAPVVDAALDEILPDCGPDEAGRARALWVRIGS